MTANRISQFFLIILLQSLFLLSGCGDNRNENAGISKLQKPGSTPLNTSVPSTSEDESQNQGTSTDVDWGSEVSLDEMITMTRNGRIVEIEVQAGKHDSPTTSLDMSDADFVKMVTGEASAMSLFTGGKLKIGGDVMKSQLFEKLFKL